jgi:hypothetical protein
LSLIASWVICGEAAAATDDDDDDASTVRFILVLVRSQEQVSDSQIGMQTYSHKLRSSHIAFPAAGAPSLLAEVRHEATSSRHFMCSNARICNQSPQRPAACELLLPSISETVHWHTASHSDNDISELDALCDRREGSHARCMMAMRYGRRGMPQLEAPGVGEELDCAAEN